MTRDELWCFILSKNSALNGADDKSVSMTIVNIRKLFDLAYKHGESNGFDRAVDLSKEFQRLKGTSSDSELSEQIRKMFNL